MRRDLSFIFGYVVRFDMNFIYKKLLVLNFKESVLISRQNEFWTIFELLILPKKFHFEMIVLANAKILFPIPVAMEGYDKIEWIKSWHRLVVLHLVAEKQFKIGLFSKNAFCRAFIWPLSLPITRIRHVSYSKRKLFIVAFKCHQNHWITSLRWREQAIEVNFSLILAKWGKPAFKRQ